MPPTASCDLSVRLAYRIRLGDDTAIALHVPVLLPTSQDDNVLALGFGVRPTFADLGQTLADLFGVGPLKHGTSFLNDILI